MRHAAGGHTWTPPVCKAFLTSLAEQEKIADIHPAFRRMQRFGPDGMRWLVPLQVCEARGSLSTPGSTSPGPTCLAINDRLPKQPVEERFAVSCRKSPRFASYAAGLGTCIGSYALPVDSRVHARRAFLLAIATAATLWCRRLTSLPSQVPARSARVLASCTSARPPWISRVRR